MLKSLGLTDNDEFVVIKDSSSCDIMEYNVTDIDKEWDGYENYDMNDTYCDVVTGGTLDVEYWLIFGKKGK